MSEKNHDSAVCELLLILFSAGALMCILYRRGIFDLKLSLPGTEEEWIAAILAVDAFMAGSLLCRFVLPMSTLVFGALSAIVGARILALHETWWRWLLLLLIAVSLHFVLSGWSLCTAAELRRALIGRGTRRRVIGSAALLAILGFLGSAAVMYLFRLGLV